MGSEFYKIYHQVLAKSNLITVDEDLGGNTSSTAGIPSHATSGDLQGDKLYNPGDSRPPMPLAIKIQKRPLIPNLLKKSAKKKK